MPVTCETAELTRQQCRHVRRLKPWSGTRWSTAGPAAAGRAVPIRASGRASSEWVTVGANRRRNIGPLDVAGHAHARDGRPSCPPRCAPLPRHMRAAGEQLAKGRPPRSGRWIGSVRRRSGRSWSRRRGRDRARPAAWSAGRRDGPLVLIKDHPVSGQTVEQWWRKAPGWLAGRGCVREDRSPTQPADAVRPLARITDRLRDKLASAATSKRAVSDVTPGVRRVVADCAQWR